jgi:hypothetical protein
VGLAKLAVEAPLSTATGEILHALSIVQTNLFLEPMGRPYTPAERAQIDWVFWNNSAWWAWQVRIKEGFSGIWQISSRPFTLKSNIMLKKWPADQGLDAAERLHLLVHESTHVWQWWNGGSSYILNSIWYQGRHALGGPDPYEWRPPVNSGTLWPGLTAEQQASFIESAFAEACYNFAGCVIGGTNYETFFHHADGHIINGTGAP